VKRVTDIPAGLPLVLRPSRTATIAAFGAAVLFGLLGLLFALSGGVVGAAFCFALAAVGLFGGVMALLPRRTELRLDEQGFAVVSPVKTRKGAWSEVQRFEEDLSRGGLERSVGEDDPAECGVGVGVIEDVECVVARDGELERVGGLVDHDDGQAVVGGAPEEEDIDPVRRAVRELTTGG
jgi:hypothetical protein